MKGLTVLFFGLFVFGCNDDARDSSQPKGSKNSSNIEYKKSQLKLASEKDSISYILGL